MNVESTPTRDAVLDVSGVTVRYRTRGHKRPIVALDGVETTVERGRTTGLVGESGAGKSTLGRAVLGLAPVSGGSIRFGGRDIVDLPASVRRRLPARVQAVYQDPLGSLNPGYPVSWSLKEPLRSRGISTRAEMTDRVAATLEAVGIDPAASHRRPAAFSGGQLQRICIARAIIDLPELVILDEAVSALDLSVQAQILNLLRDLQEERQLSYLFISHDMAVVRHCCHEVTVLYRGQVMESGPTGAVAAAPAHPYTNALLRASPVADPVVQRARQQAAPTATDHEPAAPVRGCVYAPRCPFAEPQCHESRPPLREIAPGRKAACHLYPQWTEELSD
ncbi:oligopeptide/dipeptide ABC transporter ATP-binding protein [Candidatus Poriferisodalis sp.]|uniref:oligopeptide/dipeptide ABC transporter ATP-binding protein n=1 Tax=Candidatus Poriferisodalis sp. TaxID=3101277 RepID=UPI003B0203FB